MTLLKVMNLVECSWPSLNVPQVPLLAGKKPSLEISSLLKYYVEHHFAKQNSLPLQLPWNVLSVWFHREAQEILTIPLIPGIVPGLEKIPPRVTHGTLWLSESCTSEMTLSGALSHRLVHLNLFPSCRGRPDLDSNVPGEWVTHGTF